jgi:hypothetical protein
MALRSRTNQRSAVLGTVKDEPPAAVAPSGAILDGTCARRSTCAAVGTKEWRHDRTKELDLIRRD